MKKIILDTNFIMSCIKNRIDFFDLLPEMGFKIIIPKEVKYEIERIKNSKQKLRFREDARFAQKLFEGEPHEEIELGKGHVDKKIMEFLEQDPEIVVGTLDQGIKKKVVNPKMVIRDSKILELV